MSAAAQIVELADAIVVDLNATQFSKPFKACRKWQPIFDREQLTTIQVTVVPRAETTVISDRSGRWQSDYRIEIGIQRHVASDSQPEIDILSLLSEEIFDRYCTTKPGSRSETLIGREWLAILSAEELNEQRIFGSFQALNFRGWREP